MEKINCTACRILLCSQDEARSHYKSDFHTYNLKRKHVQLEPVTFEKYQEKIEENKILTREEVRELKCECCNQVFSNEKLLIKHQKSHQDPSVAVKVDPVLTCLFCSNKVENLEFNLKHMAETHGFFIPDIEYVKSFETLLAYLHSKVGELLMCLYCNNHQGHSFRSLSSVQQHMRDKQHCFLNTDNTEEFKEYYLNEQERSFEVLSSEDEIKLEHYIELGSQSSETASYSLLSSHHSTANGNLNKFGELRLHNGKVAGLKDYSRYYKQYYRPMPKRNQEFLAIVGEKTVKDDNEKQIMQTDESINDKMLKQGMKNNMLQHHLRKQV